MREDDVRLEDLDPVHDSASPPHWQSMNILELRPSAGMSSSSETPGASSSRGWREKRKERNPMA